MDTPPSERKHDFTRIKVKPGHKLDATLHELTGYKTKDASTSLDEAHALLMSLFYEYLTIRCKIVWSHKRARWFCKLTDVWHMANGETEIRAIGKAYGTTLAMSICLAVMRLYGLKRVTEDVPHIPNNQALAQFFEKQKSRR